MIDLVAGILQFCASCVADNNVIPPAVGALAGAAGAVGGMGGLSGLQGSGSDSAVPPDGAGVPAVDAHVPPANPGTPPGKSGGHGKGPEAPGGPSTVVQTTDADGNPVLKMTWPDGTTMDVTDGRHPTTTITDPDGFVTTTTGTEGDHVTTDSGYPGGPTFSTTQTAGGGDTETWTTPFPGGGGESYVSTRGGSFSTGVSFPGSGFGTTTEPDGTIHPDVLPPEFIPPKPK